ncbi:hypothetical protein [Clostridium folliculivorans]|uniref:hypothetical protein n=1 Tax=Clostridium folliculivorans TaxID=2886038 RepID=UPI0021C2B6F5|nr:hypothetical protein [Clostridium folliculivorans]
MFASIKSLIYSIYCLCYSITVPGVSIDGICRNEEEYGTLDKYSHLMVFHKIFRIKSYAIIIYVAATQSDKDTKS